MARTIIIEEKKGKEKYFKSLLSMVDTMEIRNLVTVKKELKQVDTKELKNVKTK